MNILAIGAHYDDVELGCGGTIAKYIKDGHSLYVYVATVSGFTNHNDEKVRSSKKALEEGKKAMEVLGVKKLYSGQFKTLEIEFTDQLNVEILNLIEELNIEMVFTHWAGDVHHDHQAVSKASLHSCRHVPNLLMYRSNWYQSNTLFKGNYYVDISDHWEVKERAIRSHESEMNRTGEKWIKFFKNEALNAGQRIGVEKAEVFEVVKYLYK